MRDGLLHAAGRCLPAATAAASTHLWISGLMRSTPAGQSLQSSTSTPVTAVLETTQKEGSVHRSSTHLRGRRAGWGAAAQGKAKQGRAGSRLQRAAAGSVA